MTDYIEKTNESIRAENPALWELLSPVGRRIAYPPDVPFQAAQAREKTYNGTIGQITDGRGQVLRIEPLADGLGALDPTSQNRALLYSTVDGFADVRKAWRRWHRRDVADDVPSTLPLLTVGLAHGLALLADLFGGDGKKVIVPSPFWGNYRQIFYARTGATVVPVPFYQDGAYHPTGPAEALDELPAGEPAVVLLNLPSNPGGYMPTVSERQRLRDSLLEAAERRPVLVICDDAYAGLVYDAEVPRRSLFWDLAGQSPNLISAKVDGATKELCFFGGRVGFLTFGFDSGTGLADAMESKSKALLRATVGSPVAVGQVLVLKALSASDIEERVEAIRKTLEARYRVLSEALNRVDRSLLRPLPCNGAAFALVELPESLGITSEEVRQHLLDHEDTGVISVPPRYLRVAFCSVATESLAELVRRLERGVATLAARGR